MIQVTICMGSSCFSRGNNQNLEVVRAWLAAHGKEAAVELKGCRCGNNCGDGPNLWINGTRYQEVRPETIPALLEKIFAEEEV
ncbi:MAG: (2Fe-2S) ferredoxin domain-containing protein [bacterium]|nr:(2Fe-2S) ferredoxin domain-containing protein [bacterium]MDO5462878.1 (2Fe-2S) ferredoxin domain-containing protein [bacterium]